MIVQNALHGRPVQSNLILASLGSSWTLHLMREDLCKQISATVYIHVLIHTAERTGVRSSEHLAQGLTRQHIIQTRFVIVESPMVQPLRHCATTEVDKLSS